MAGEKEDPDKTDFFDEVDDSSGCAEIWEKLSRKRKQADD